ncbi:hypothetical protein L6164_021424 [Bauhinia variegata]|uniref:Uncharacterized protein n=1 Tax=Bauhinia variegata TaxID=167791 RepID=A0ACB9MZN7_BAUVA|nr:hypothetical protein L6164_021424 [Bauhinia variegata]
MFSNLVPTVPNVSNSLGLNKGPKIKGTVVLIKKNMVDFSDVVGSVVGVTTSVVDLATEFLVEGITLQLVSATNADPGNGLKGKVGKPGSVENWFTSLPNLTGAETVFTVHFDYEEDTGVPGAFLIKNNHLTEFFLVRLTLHDVPNHGDIHFVCNSWIYPASYYKRPRVFFANKAYLPSETPQLLLKYREEELEDLRGDGTGERQKWDRIYDYDVYNDLGNPDSIIGDLVRPVIGGSSTYPYPRRGRTGRPPTSSDPKSESRMFPLEPSFEIYIPRDERFGHLKMADFLTYMLKAVNQNLRPALEYAFTFLSNEFKDFEDVRELYEGGFKLPGDVLNSISNQIPTPMLREFLRSDGEQTLRYPTPRLIQKNKSAWMTDEEFAREMLAGVNPGLIQCLKEFPPKSKLDPNVYGDQTSTVTKQHLAVNLDGCSVDEAINNNRLFILDHHDAYMPFLRRINETSNKAYATRTILFLKGDGTLKPVAIELSIPHPDGDKFGAESTVHLPAEQGVEGTIWLLAKAYVSVNDAGYHQLVSHWLNTHAVIEPFIIATNRHLSVLHPIHKLLHPHYRDTMNINALARQSLVNAGGIIELTFLPGKYAIEMSSAVYKNWVFPEQALPVDLVKRGMAVEDPSCPHGLRLVIEDYPFAVDGLEIWDAIKTWVHDYVTFYYKTDEAIKQDSELQEWWKELVKVGHGDKQDEPWWFKMQNREELIETCTIVIWIASALHAAVNFGQYPYGGYIVNRPTLSRRLVPKKGTPEYDEMVKSPHVALLRTITPKLQTLIDLSVIEILSRHTSDELYLGQREDEHWTSDAKPLEALKKFGKKLEEIEKKLIERNHDENLRNRNGPVNMPYTLLYPKSEKGLTGQGIPNSISI